MINGNKKHKESLSRFDKLALWVNDHCGTIEFTIFCFVLVSIPILKPSTQTVIFYISSGYLQLLFLPLILMGSNLQQKHAEKVEESHFENMKALEERIISLIEEKKI